MNINNDLRNFMNFANAADAGTCAEMRGNGSVGDAANKAGALARFFGATQNARAAADLNNRTRQALVDALKRQFNAESFANLPDAVKNALVGTHASTADGDFAFDANGRVTSGKPLTARRIRAVMTAIEGLQTARAANAAPVSAETVQARRAALAPHLEAFARKLAVAPAGYKVPIVMDRFAGVALQVFTSPTAVNLLAGVGSAAGKTLEVAREKLLKQVDRCGVLPEYWNGGTRPDDDRDPTPGTVGRERVVEGLVNELIRDFNAAHPELALR